MASNVVDITIENVQDVLAQSTQDKVVLFSFWAAGFEQCDAIAPILEQIASEYSDTVILARVDCQKEQAIAGQFGIQNLPTVMVVQNGQPVDGFAGAQPEPQIREMLAKYLPKPEDALMAKAGEHIMAGEYTEAFPYAKQALEVAPDNVNVKYLFIDCLIETGSVGEAKALVETIGLVDQDSRYQSLVGKIELAEQAADSPEIQALQAKLEANPDDLQLKVELSVQLQQANRKDEALALLFTVLQKDLNFGDAKKTMLDMVNALVDGDPLKSTYRRKVYSLLY